MSVQWIDLNQYPRRSHFEYFRSMAYPYVGLTVQAEVTALYRAAKARQGSFFLACLYCAARAANRVPQLRQRILHGQIAQFDHCDTSHTLALPDGTYCYCRLDCRTGFDDFLSRGRMAQEAARQSHGIGGQGDETPLLFVSCIPWVLPTRPSSSRFPALPAATPGSPLGNMRRWAGKCACPSASWPTTALWTDCT